MKLDDNIDKSKLDLGESDEISWINKEDNNFTFTFNEMKNFNVLIGKNGSGKSRILKAFNEKLGVGYSKLKAYGNIHNCGQLVFYDLRQYKKESEASILSKSYYDEHYYQNYYNKEYLGDKNNQEFKSELVKIRLKTWFNYKSLSVRIEEEQADYGNKVDDKNFVNKEEEKEFKNKYLFAKINNFITENETIKKLFKYRIKPLTKPENHNNNIPKLFFKLQEHLQEADIESQYIEYQKLSQGEKVLLDLIYFIYALKHEDGVLTSQEKDQGRQVILLLDEPDAHLHHSSAKSMIETLQSFAEEFNIVVILATHNLSTIKYSNANCLFEITNNGDKVVVNPVDKQTAMANLTDNENWSDAFASLIQYIPDDIQKIVVVEGKYDKFIFDKAIELRYPKLKNNTLIISAGGEKNIKNPIEVLIKIFAEQKFAEQNRYFNFYGIFDNDSKNDIVKNMAKHNKYIDDLKLENYAEEIREYNNKKAKAIVLHTGDKDADAIFKGQENLVIEYMFNKKLLKEALTPQSFKGLNPKKGVVEDPNGIFMYNYDTPGDKIKEKLSDYIKDNAKKEDFKYFDSIIKLITDTDSEAKQ
jgi:energy-coupling factor transporter ATP-binding protein EcfA2